MNKSVKLIFLFLIILGIILFAVFVILLFIKKKKKSNADINDVNIYVKSVNINESVKKIIDIINDRKNSLLNSEDIDDKIYYLNSNDNTLFNWVMYNKLCDFVCFYTNSEPAIKVCINSNGTSNLYAYKDNQIISTEELLFDKEEIHKLAIILSLTADNNTLFNKSITDIDTDISISEDDIKKFDDNVNNVLPKI